MEYTLSLTFITEHGIKTSLSILSVKRDITKDQINALMNTIIAKNVFSTNDRDFTKKSDAQLTQRQVIKFNLV